MSRKAIIIEDEINSQKLLGSIVENFIPDLEVVGVFKSNVEASAFFDKPHSPIDIAFLDINLLDGAIFSTLDQLEDIAFNIIFVTAYEEYAVKAFDYSAIGYVLKPIDPQAIIDAVKRVPAIPQKMNERVEMLKSYYQNPNTFSKITISALDGIYFLEMSEIIRMEAEDNYTHIFTTKDSKITVSKTIKVYEDLLTNFNFYRIHKSHIVNMNFIKKFNRNERQIIMVDGSKLEVARRRIAGFLERLENLQGRY